MSWIFMWAWDRITAPSASNRPSGVRQRFLTVRSTRRHVSTSASGTTPLGYSSVLVKSTSHLSLLGTFVPLGFHVYRGRNVRTARRQHPLQPERRAPFG